MFKRTDMKIWNIDKFWKIIALAAKRTRMREDWNEEIIAPRIVCKDGFSVSVQAGSCMHSEPRKNGLIEYESYELGWPTKHDKLLDKWAEYVCEEKDTDWTRMTYAYVPKKIVNKMIRKHGGIVDVKWKF